MSETTVQERVTFEVVPQQNHIGDLLGLPVASETPGLDALMNAPEIERERQLQGRFENEEKWGISQSWYAKRAWGMDIDEGMISEYQRRWPHRWLIDRRRAVKKIQQRFYRDGDVGKARDALLEWELECVFTSSGVLVPVELIPQQRWGTHTATCMPGRSRTLRFVEERVIPNRFR